ncbi:unnamed protein product [Prorocentrum cordatum]|uniref:Protein kinase domain-containing protein n=1 Tax=Prorocentrum cordatum TaxID=2364126 RepID=A0ABN9W7P9_9DINO|nr:unnamed protein product [Polarella glacialis]
MRPWRSGNSISFAVSNIQTLSLPWIHRVAIVCGTGAGGHRGPYSAFGCALLLYGPSGRGVRHAPVRPSGCRIADLHGRNTVHRDLKPANCLVSKEGVLKLIDFNIAASTEEGELLTPTGTREFCAPEVLSMPYASPADVWSLGLCLHFMLHGRMPFGDCDGEPTAASLAAASTATGSDCASDGSSDGSDCSGRARAMTENPKDAWGGSMWALRRCHLQDWRLRATAQDRGSSRAPPAGSPPAEPGRARARGGGCQRAGSARTTWVRKEGVQCRAEQILFILNRTRCPRRRGLCRIMRFGTARSKAQLLLRRGCAG